MRKLKVLLMIGIFVPTVLFTSCKKDEEKGTPTDNPTGEFTDSRDGQVYKWVKIGEQTWMAENLNYETLDSWWYDDSPSNGEIYGRLYLWDAAVNACPSGWHLPTDEEWKTLGMALGLNEVDTNGSYVTEVGGKMKEAGTAHWKSPNSGATNSSGFTALPGGFRIVNESSFNVLGLFGNWWSSSPETVTTARIWELYYYSNDMGGYITSKSGYGCSVRCIKD